MAAGALILGAGMLGAWAGADAGNGAETLQPQEAATVKIPIPKALPDVDGAAAATIAAVPASRVEPTHRSSGKRESKPLEIRLPEQEQPALGEPVDPSQLPEIAVDRPATPPAQAAAPQATPAKLPLSNATIARTIGRIGYPCGSVASTTEGDGPGVFTVNCTSGHSYRAAPVRGRYHFRRLSGQ